MPQPQEDSVSTYRTAEEYIDPDMAVTLDEVRRRHAADFTSEAGVTFVDPDSDPASTSYRFQSSGEWVMGSTRGRSPVSCRRRRGSLVVGHSRGPSSSASTDRANMEYIGSDAAVTLEPQPQNDSASTYRSAKEYIDPELAVTLDEVSGRHADDLASGGVTYVYPDPTSASTSYRFETSGEWIVGKRRGRSPASSRRRRGSPYGRTPSSATSLSEESPSIAGEDARAKEDAKSDFGDSNSIVGEDESINGVGRLWPGMHSDQA